jgi:hypothetical protein
MPLVKGKYWLLLILAFALALLVACGMQENCAEAHNDDRTYRLHVCTDREKYDFGETVYITFTVTNVSDQPVTLNGGDEPAIDIWVTRDQWSNGRELTLDLTRVTLELGESRTIEFSWPTPPTDLDSLTGYGALTIGARGVVMPWPGADRSVRVWFQYGEGIGH